MKILTIGDRHGDDIPKIKFDQYDKVIFTGDYFDDFNNSIEKQLVNFKSLLNLKATYPNKIKLLIGNHDIHYCLMHTQWFEQIRGSGFNPQILYIVYSLFRRYESYFLAAYQIDNYLWTHAGISNLSYELYFKDRILPGENLADGLNRLWNLYDGSLFHIGQKRNGSDQVGSIFWADLEDTYEDCLDDYHQIVGHTPVKKIIKNMINDDTSITYVDTRLGNKEYLITKIQDIKINENID